MAGMLEQVCMCRLAVIDGDIPFQLQIMIRGPGIF